MSNFSSDYAMGQGIRQMEDFFQESPKLELIGGVTSLVWLFAGLFSDGFLLLVSLVITVLIFIILSFYSLYPNSNYFYDIHVSSFRRMVVGGLAHWAYTSGGSQGPNEISFFNYTIPIITISEITIIFMVVLWFGSRYYDQLKDENIEDVMIPFLITRGLFRGAILTGMIYAMVSTSEIPMEFQFPWLITIYIIEPFLFAVSQYFNKTYSTMELSYGNARLPAVALRESFVSNLFILLITMGFDGLVGDEWQLVRVYYVIGVIVVFIYSWEAIKKFAEMPLGTEPIGEFLRDTPDEIRDIKLSEKYGHQLHNEMSLNLTKDSVLEIAKGSIIIPLEEKKNKISTLILGKANNILEEKGTKFGETLDGVTTALIPKNEFVNIKRNVIAKKLTELRYEEFNLPTIPEIEQMVNNLAIKMENWVENIASTVNKIDLSNYSITSDGPNQIVHLPGILVNETTDLTTVKVAGIRVYDGKNGSTVRIGNLINVLDVPKFSFVDIPGITVLDIEGEGSAISLFGLKISDGIPADRLMEFKELVLKKINKFEIGLDAELGRLLADKSSSGVFSLNSSGDFKPLLESNKKKIGDHDVIKSLPSGSSMIYLPEKFYKKKSSDDLLQLTGTKEGQRQMKEKEDFDTEKSSAKHSVKKEIDKAKKSIKEEKSYEFSRIIDAEVIEDEENED